MITKNVQTNDKDFIRIKLNNQLIVKSIESKLQFAISVVAINDFMVICSRPTEESELYFPSFFLPVSYDETFIIFTGDNKVEDTKHTIKYDNNEVIIKDCELGYMATNKKEIEVGDKVVDLDNNMFTIVAIGHSDYVIENVYGKFIVITKKDCNYKFIEYN